MAHSSLPEDYTGATVVSLSLSAVATSFSVRLRFVLALYLRLQWWPKLHC
jgi:hypothetical protein